MRTLLFISAATLFFASCQSDSLIRPGDSIEVAFEKAMNLYEQEEWSDAARAFETVVSIGRGTDSGQDAQYYLAESYFNNRRYLIAASEYDRFVQFYPNSPRRVEVDFKRAKSYYNLSPRYRLDQEYTYRALELFRLFNSRYPDSEYVAESSELITEMREKLARKQYSAGEFYKRTSRYNAAAVYYDIVIDDFPETSWAQLALVSQMESYILFAENSVRARQKERFELALESYYTYLQLFPRGEHRSEMERLYERAQRGLTEVEQRESVASQSSR